VARDVGQGCKSSESSETVGTVLILILSDDVACWKLRGRAGMVLCKLPSGDRRRTVGGGYDTLSDVAPLKVCGS
jgi:hypothetical protein